MRRSLVPGRRHLIGPGGSIQLGVGRHHDGRRRGHGLELIPELEGRGNLCVERWLHHLLLLLLALVVLDAQAIARLLLGGRVIGTMDLDLGLLYLKLINPNSRAMSLPLIAAAAAVVAGGLTAPLRLLSLRLRLHLRVHLLLILILILIQILIKILDRILNLNLNLRLHLVLRLLPGQGQLQVEATQLAQVLAQAEIEIVHLVVTQLLELGQIRGNHPLAEIKLQILQDARRLSSFVLSSSLGWDSVRFGAIAISGYQWILLLFLGLEIFAILSFFVSNFGDFMIIAL